jgi:hypothetical protein
MMRAMQTARVAVVVAVLAVAGGCVLPGHAGWECDSDSDCQSGLACKSMHGDKGYTQVCMRPGEDTYVGSKGDWLHLIMYPLIGLCLGAIVIRKIVDARRRRRGDVDPPPRRRRRR